MIIACALVLNDELPEFLEERLERTILNQVGVPVVEAWVRDVVGDIFPFEPKVRVDREEKRVKPPTARQ